MTQDYKVNHDSLATLVDTLIKSGVHGVLPLGTSGEFSLLDQEERSQVIRTVVEAAARRVPVIAGVSDAGTKNAVDNAVRAEKLGADAVIATPPYYYHVSQEGVYNHFKMLAQAVSIPVMVYNIPSYTHTEIPVDLLAKIAQIENVVGIKFTTTDFQMFLECLYATQSNKFSVLIGADSMIFQAIQAGADGAVTGLANVAPRECVDIYNNLKAGRPQAALETQRRIFPLTQAMNLGDFPAGLKEMANMLGLNAGPVRYPLTPLSETQRQLVGDLLARNHPSN